MDRTREPRRNVSHWMTYAAIVLLIAGNVFLALCVVHKPSPGLRMSVLDIGQGDSILVTGPTGLTMLVDGGPDKSVLRQLPKELGPLNRHIDLVVETHPDADHISGLSDVIEQYSVSMFMSPGIPDSTATSKRLAAELTSHPKIKQIVAKRGMRINLGGGAYADILHPDRDMSKETVTNDGSITMHVVYGKTSFMLTGDLPSPVEDWLIALDGPSKEFPNGDGELPTTVLKAGHHGSKYSTSSEWLKALDPQTIAISVGKNNPYGHPNPETITRIKAAGVPYIETENVGTIDFFSDGEKVTEHSEGL